MLSVRNGAKAVAFYAAAFGAETLFLLNDGGAVVAQLSACGAVFWVADESPQHFNFSPETLGGSTVRLVMIADDPDAAFDRPSRLELRPCGQSLTSPIIGAWGDSPIPLGIIGRSANRCADCEPSATCGPDGATHTYNNDSGLVGNASQLQQYDRRRHVWRGGLVDGCCAAQGRRL